MLTFNDSILALYVILCLYFMSSGWPKISVFMLTIAISIKAGALLMVPAALGWVHY
jgi:Gpi18-like mannosyltransferase